MLKPVFNHRETRGPPYLGIVIVPSAGLAPPSEWSHSPGSPWLGQLTEDIPSSIGIWEFEYRTARKKSLAENLVNDAHKLLEVLLEHCTGPHSRQPLVFICHGMGGFVLKKALCFCREQLFQYQAVINVISGVIFLGSPNLKTDAMQVRHTLDLMLRCQDKKSAGPNISNINDITTIMSICESLELVNLNVPIVSVYEKKETMTKGRIFAKVLGRQRGSVVVPKSLCCLGVHSETVVESDADHFDVCKIAVESAVYRTVVQLLHDVLENYSAVLTRKFQSYRVPSVLRDATLCSESTSAYARSTGLRSRTKSMTQFSSSHPSAAVASTSGGHEFTPALPALDDVILPHFSLGIPQTPGEFHGREGLLNDIDKHLLPSSEEPDLRTFAICGLGGMGKTALALEYAYTREHFFEVVFWLNGNNPKRLAAEFAQIAHLLGLENDYRNLVANRDVVMGWLSRPLRARPDKPENEVDWLLIFDGVDDLDVLEDYWPRTGRGSVLVTSRDPLVSSLFVENRLDLLPLTQTESEVLMQRLANVEADVSQREALSLLVEKLGGLPLAIDRMARTIREQGLSYTEILGYHNGKGYHEMYLQTPDTPHYEKLLSLAETWSLDRLPPAAMALLRIVCLLDPDGIPERIFIHINGTIELENYPRNYEDYLDAMYKLCSQSLIKKNRILGSISVHRVVQSHVKALMDESQLSAAFRTATALVISAWKSMSPDNDHSTAHKAISPSIVHPKKGIEALVRDGQTFLPDIQIAELFNHAGRYMLEGGHHEEHKYFCNLALEIGEALHNGDTTDENVLRVIRQSREYLSMSMLESDEDISHTQAVPRADGFDNLEGLTCDAHT